MVSMQGSKRSVAAMPVACFTKFSACQLYRRAQVAMNFEGDETEEKKSEEEKLLDEIQNSDVPESVKSEHEFLCWQMRARELQQSWYDRLGDRTYDFIEFDKSYNGMKPLEMKVSFAIYGYPSKDNKNEKEQKEYVQKMCDKIMEASKKMNSSNSLYFSVLFIPCFIEATKVFKRNPPQEFVDVVFKIGKELDDEEYKLVDSKLRIYNSWQNFKSNNKYPKCWYALPREAKYDVGCDGSVLLEFEKSPPCFLKSRVGDSLDTTSLVLTVGSAAVGIAGMFTPLGAPILIGSLAVGGMSGVYSAGRSINTLVDRHSHQQSLADREAALVWLDLGLSTFSIAVNARAFYSTARMATAVSKVAKAEEAIRGAVTAGESIASNVASKAGNSAVKVGKNANKLMKSARAATRAASKISAKSGSKVINTAVKTSKAGVSQAVEKITKGKKIATVISNTAGTVSTSSKTAAKNGKQIVDTVSKAAKIAATKSAPNIAAGSSKVSSLVDDVISGVSTSTKITKVGTKVNKIATSKLPTGIKNATNLVTKMNSELIQVCGYSGSVLLSKGIVRVAEVVWSVALDKITSNISQKHKDFLQQIFKILHKYFTGSLDPLDISQFIAHLNFYFNAIIREEDDFIDSILWKLYDAIGKLVANTTNKVKGAFQKKTIYVLYPQKTKDGSEVIDTVFEELQASDIDWSQLNLPQFTDKIMDETASTDSWETLSQQSSFE